MHDFQSTWFERFGCIEYARDTAIGLVREAGELLDRIELTPAAESLKQLADFIVTRRQ